MGIFHGGKALCETRKTRAVLISTNGVAEWGQTIVFPIKVSNLPRMARLCFGIYEMVKFKSRRKLKESSKVIVIFVFSIVVIEYYFYNKYKLRKNSNFFLYIIKLVRCLLIIYLFLTII